MPGGTVLLMSGYTMAPCINNHYFLSSLTLCDSFVSAALFLRKYMCLLTYITMLMGGWGQQHHICFLYMYINTVAFILRVFHYHTHYNGENGIEFTGKSIVMHI